MKIPETLILLAFGILPSSGCASVNGGPNLNRSAIVQWVGNRNTDFNDDLNKAVEGLRTFAGQYGWDQASSPNFVKEIRHFESKDLFDSELRHVSGGQMKNIPATYVALMDDRILRVVSWSAYRQIHPDHEKADYIRVLQHELAHQLHVDLVGDQGMGPTWFYEGFAVVAAGQYENASLSESEMEKVIRSEERGSYPKFGYSVRSLMKRYSLPQLVDWARLERSQFLAKIGYPKIH